ncbi:fungal-specific transcription factor domain-containing protein [Apodospora peruviana]|uniref:Fungal-specific transcription factor domain-containing protein n=1 Tax=Apodospora peruviana TaxID=516989 RepID=A0AAE0IBR1_9PEZI|nr:fungal-specific transcription factor domain-containing protein [Apodospora peruviana]
MSSGNRHQLNKIPTSRAPEHDRSSTSAAPTSQANHASFASREPQRVRRACEGCRKRKIKCNGEDPCLRCSNLRVHCGYAEQHGVALARTLDISNGMTALNERFEELEKANERRMSNIEEMLRQISHRLSSSESDPSPPPPPPIDLPAARRGTSLMPPPSVAQCNNTVVNSIEHESSLDVLVNAAASVQVPPHQQAGPINCAPEAASPEADVDDGWTKREDDTGRLEEDSSLQDEAGTNNDDEARTASEQTDEFYTDGYGDLEMDSHGQLRYVGLGSIASVVDRCDCLRRQIAAGLRQKGYDSSQPFLTSPAPAPSPTTLTHLFAPPTPVLPPRRLVHVLIGTYIQDVLYIFPILPIDTLWSIYSELLTHGVRDTAYASVFFGALTAAAALIPESDPVFDEIPPEFAKKGLDQYFYRLAKGFADAAPVVVDDCGRRRGRRNANQDVVIACALLSMYLAGVGSQAEAWIMSGRAIRIAQDLGLHRDPERLQLPKKERTERRFIWWCLYLLDRQLSTALGRPLAIDDDDCDVSLPTPEADTTRYADNTGFCGCLPLYRALGMILKTVNSVNNACKVRQAGNYDTLRGQVHEIDRAIQRWASEVVPPEVKKATQGRCLIEKHITLSYYHAAVILLYRAFLPQPPHHNRDTSSSSNSPLSNSKEAQIRCAKAASDCIRGSPDYLMCVPRGHYRVVHGQNIFVSAVILLQCIRSNDRITSIDAALGHVRCALDGLKALEEEWKGAKKCQGIIEEYLEFTLRMLSGEFDVADGCGCYQSKKDGKKTRCRGHDREEEGRPVAKRQRVGERPAADEGRVTAGPSSSSAAWFRGAEYRPASLRASLNRLRQQQHQHLSSSSDTGATTAMPPASSSGRKDSDINVTSRPPTRTSPHTPSPSAVSTKALGIDAALNMNTSWPFTYGENGTPMPLNLDFGMMMQQSGNGSGMADEMSDLNVSDIAMLAPSFSSQVDHDKGQYFRSPR